MDVRRAQDLLKHITQDKDYGIETIKKIPLADAVFVVNKMLPDCIQKAQDDGNENDAGYFSTVMRQYRPIILDKLRNIERVWIAYSALTGYPYILDGDLVAIYDYSQHVRVEQTLNNAGYRVAFGSEDSAAFRDEVAHMYRNGYKNIRFMCEKMEPFVVSREELFGYDTFFNEDYVTNPGLQSAAISYFQEARKRMPKAGREIILQSREKEMHRAMANAEYMVPCIKEENEDTVEISHPFLDLTERIRGAADNGGAAGGEKDKIIAVPVFTDGHEMEKCYAGQHENMLYRFDELIDLIDKLEASGIIINCLGISYYVDKKQMKRIARLA